MYMCMCLSAHVHVSVCACVSTCVHVCLSTYVWMYLQARLTPFVMADKKKCATIIMLVKSFKGEASNKTLSSRSIQGKFYF